MVQSSCDLNVKLIKWRDAVYSYDTVPKVYGQTTESVSPSPGISLTETIRVYLLAVQLPSRAVGHWERTKRCTWSTASIRGKAGFMSLVIFRNRRNRICICCLRCCYDAKTKIQSKLCKKCLILFVRISYHIEVYNINSLSDTVLTKPVSNPKLIRCRINNREK